MKNPGRKIAPFLATFFCVLLLCTMVTYAASTTLMTYSGTGIRDKASVKTFTLSSTTTITVHHTTTGFEKNLSQSMLKFRCCVKRDLVSTKRAIVFAYTRQIQDPSLGEKIVAHTD